MFFQKMCAAAPSGTFYESLVFKIAHYQIEYNLSIYNVHINYIFIFVHIL